MQGHLGHRCCCCQGASIHIRNFDDRSAVHLGVNDIDSEQHRRQVRLCCVHVLVHVHVHVPVRVSWGKQRGALRFVV